VAYTKEQIREYMRTYRKTEKYKAYVNSEKHKKYQREYMKTYEQTEKYKTYQKAYREKMTEKICK
jgi:hypothetical protein